MAAFAKHFRQFQQPMLAESIFAICEAARIDWTIARQYRGSASDLALEKGLALEQRETHGLSPRLQLLEVLVQCSLDATDTSFVSTDLRLAAVELVEYLNMLKHPAASVQDSMDVMGHCYAVLGDTAIDLKPLPLVRYRGTLPFDDASINLQLTALEDMQAELSEEFEDEELFQLKGTMDEADIDVDELEPGEVENPTAIMTADDQLSGDDFDQVDDPTGLKQMERLRELRQEKAELTYKYDEWDHNIQDYRRRFLHAV